MYKRKSLFSKYLTISLLIVIISFLILGVMLVYFVAQYSSLQKHTSLEENTVVVADFVSSASDVVNETLYINPSQTALLSNVAETFSSNSDSDILIANLQGNVFFCSEGTYCMHSGITIPTEICNKIINQPQVTSFTSDMGGIYDKTQIVYAKAVTKDVGQYVMPVAIVFSVSPNTFFSEFTGNITSIFFMAALITFFIVFCIIGLFSYNMVNPLKQMSKAAKDFAKGDFTRRVPVKSEDEIGQLSSAFNDMADSLAASESTRRSFIANVSHELKTPMTTIAGFIDGILDGTIPYERQDYYLRIVSAEIRRLSRLVTSMLSLSRIDNGDLKMNKQRFNLTETAINTLLTFEQKLSDKNIDVQGLENVEQIFIDGDPDMIHQVIYNLLENASKFTNESGYIKINIQDDPDKVLLEITNSGQGIAPDELMHIFERFYKTDKSRSQDKNGMGLGLYIVKTIIRLHGGDITVKSVVNEYCTFSFWLPKEKPTKPRADKDKKVKISDSAAKSTVNDRMIYVDAEIKDIKTEGRIEIDDKEDLE